MGGCKIKCMFGIILERQQFISITAARHTRVSGYKMMPMTMDSYSKIPWYPKLLFQRENALASF
jgi:hypothetical protein